MRSAWNGTSFISLNNEVIGICLGYDFCSEHEWGIRPLERYLGMQKTKKTLMGLGPEKPVLGIDSRRIHTLDVKDLHWQETLDGEARLLYVPHLNVCYGYDEKRIEEMLTSLVERELTFSKFDKEKGHTLKTAWADKGFGIAVRGNDNIEHLRNIYEALADNNAIVTLAHTAYPSVFPEGGLYVLIGDKFPSEIDEAMKADDQDKIDLAKAHEKLGLEDELKASGVRWFALSPKWLKDFRSEVETEYELIYWLNPMDQDENRCGWFTVEELRLWPEGNGPVPKKNNSKKEE